jgi:flagellar hook-basal body complex protein FliE
MTDPLGLIGRSSGIQRDFAGVGAAKPPQQGPAFKNLLHDEIRKVNDLQQDARKAMEDLAAGRRDDIEGVLVATQKADTAFRLLLQVRNKMVEAYDEVKQIRV